jgi:hypothetical protein
VNFSAAIWPGLDNAGVARNPWKSIIVASGTAPGAPTVSLGTPVVIRVAGENNATKKTVRVKWTSVPGVKSYNVKRSDTPNGPFMTDFGKNLLLQNEREQRHVGIARLRLSGHQHSTIGNEEVAANGTPRKPTCVLIVSACSHCMPVYLDEVIRLRAAWQAVTEDSLWKASAGARGLTSAIRKTPHGS